MHCGTNNLYPVRSPQGGALLDCAFVTYTVSAKQKQLGVDPLTIKRFNLTSEEVAAEMAKGAIARSTANVAISNTGVVDNVDPAIKPGTQCIAWVFKSPGKSGELSIFTETKLFSGSSKKIRQRCALYALSRLPYYAQKNQSKDASPE